MATREQYFDLLNQLETTRARLADLQAAEQPDHPALASAISTVITDMKALSTRIEVETEAPTDHGLTDLIGLGPTAADDIGETRASVGVAPYDDTVTSERLLAIGDLYYQYQHERAGVFRSVLKLQQLFKAGQVRLSSGDGALALYQYDRQKVLRHTFKERMQAYKRVFGYTTVAPPPGAKSNRGFHRLFTNFNSQVARFYRDSRISGLFESTRPDLAFGSIARVRRSGLDLRANLKGASYGHVNVLIIEISQLLEFAFEILAASDVRRLFGADTAWDVLEDLLRRYLKEENWSSQRSRMAHAGREIIRWLAQPHILTVGRTEFETLLQGVGEYSEEWITSAQSLGTGKTPVAVPSNVVRMTARREVG